MGWSTWEEALCPDREPEDGFGTGEGPAAASWVTSRHVAAAADWRPAECQAAESGMSA